MLRLSSVLVLIISLCCLVSCSIPLVRPPYSARLFHSPAIDNAISSISARMKDADLANLFTNCYPSPLDTTVHFQWINTSHSAATSDDSLSDDYSRSIPDAFVITGDIDAQWSRDLLNQISPYFPYIGSDSVLQSMFCGSITRLTRYVLIDSYANAFNQNASGNGWQTDQRKPKMQKIIYEGKYEPDSLLAWIKLVRQYWEHTGDFSCFGDSINTDEAINVYGFQQNSSFFQAIETILDTFEVQQSPSKPPAAEPYLFQRQTSVATDTLPQSGAGPMARYTGMTKSKFRPSDDANTLPFHIPSNAMGVVELNHLVQLLGNLTELFESAEQIKYFHEYGISTDRMMEWNIVRKQLIIKCYDLISRAKQLSTQFLAGIQQFGIVPIPGNSSASGQMFAYEVDGFGGSVLMDDANIPSLLSLPLLGFVSAQDPLYVATRRFLWSSANPFFFSGTAGEGIGGPHVGINMVWPMSIITYAMTSDNDNEILDCLEMLKASSAGTGFLHESFNKDNASDFTRPWFSWVNAYFGELIIKLSKERPYLIFKS